MKKYIYAVILLSVFYLKVYSQQNKSDNADQRLFKNPVSAPFVSEWDKVPDAVKNKNSFKRFEWFYRSRLDLKGDFPKEFIEQQKQAELRKVNNKDKNNNWTNIGPLGVDMSTSRPAHWGVNSGRIRGLAIHPTNPDIVYAGAAAGGIWKTTNGGLNWIDKSGELNLITFGAIAIDQLNPNVIYAGTGEARFNFSMTTFEGDGLYKSVNGGETWTKITNGFGSKTQFADIVVSPVNSNILLAAIGMGNWTSQNPDNVGLWRSSDAGITWTRILDYTGAFDVAFHPTDGNIAYASFGNNTELGFMISTNAGLNWTSSNTGLPTADLRSRIQFDISKNNPSVLYSIIFNSSAISGGMKTCAYKSTNSGVSWSQISSGENIAGSYNGTTVDDQGGYDLCIAVHPDNPLVAFFGNVELSKTTDGSAINFIRNPAGYYGGINAWDGWTHTDVHIIKFAPSNSNVMYVGCDGGVYKSTNGGASFFHVNNGINSIQFYRLASHPTNQNILYGGAQDNGNFRTVNKGVSNWIFATTGDGMECFVDYSNPDRAYMSTQNGSLKRTTNGGTTWSSLISDYSNTAWTAPFWQHPSNPEKLYAALDRRIYMSTNTGNNWSDISGEIATSNIITSAAQSSANTNNMMVVLSNYTNNPKVFVSTNEGVDFSDVSSNITGSGFSNALIQRVNADPLNGNTFYVARASYADGQVLKTTNLGTNWTDISSDLPKISTNVIFADPSNAGQIYAGNDFGVYRSLNSGANWVKLGNGFPFVPVLSFSFFSNGSSRYLRAGTHGRGAYELDISGTVGIQSNNEEISNEYILSQNYPNPFNPTTNIKFTIPQVSSSHVPGGNLVQLKVYDITGREVQTLVNEKLQSGTYESSFDGSQFTSGIYFYKLTTNGFSQTNKMILLK